MKRIKDREAFTAWSMLGALIIIYEILAPEGQLLSEAVDRALIHHPWLTRAGIALITLHLLNLLPDKVDPVHLLAVRMRRRDQWQRLSHTLRAGRAGVASIRRTARPAISPSVGQQLSTSIALAVGANALRTLDS